jgi:hypothetical protein
MKRGDLASVLHIWNTGSANGKTYHEDYTTNALKVKTFYDELLTAKPFNSAAASIRDSAESNEHALTGEIDPTDEGTPGSTEQPPISDEPKMTLWQRMTGWTERLNVIGNFRSSLPEMPKMSAGSWVMTIWTKFWGWILFGIGIIWQNPWLLIPGLVLIILAVWYFSGSKDRATSRITPPAQAQEQTVVVK